MKIRIEEIMINKKMRIRQEIGNLDELTRSMSKFGLLQPLVVDREFNLIAGYRRYLSAKKLGWKTIEVIAVDAKTKLSKLEIEMDENIARKDFTYDEIDQAIDRRERYSKPPFFKSILKFILKLFFR